MNFVLPWSQCEHCLGRFQHSSILAFATFGCLLLISIMGVLGFVSHPLNSCATFCAHPFRLQIHRSMVSPLAMRQCMSNVITFVNSWTGFVASNLSCSYARGPFLGCAFRWGEALHPGPQYRFAITNPTSVVSKIDHYTSLVQTYDLQVVVAAETSATGIAQRVFRQKLKTLSMRSCWSVPVPDQFCTLSGAASLRGKAMGVAAFSKQPIRDAISTLPPDVVALSRISHHIVTLGTMQVQLLVVYGFPGTYPDSHGLNSQLLTNALEAIDQISLPAIIAGDFNCDPFELSIATELQIRGFQDLKALHHRIYGTAMAFTCRQATHPDNALICPELAATVCQVMVHEEPLFDTHCPVIFELDIKHQQQFRSGLNLPKSWISLSFDDSYWIRSYSDVRRLHGAPSDLPEWGVLVEHAADRVFRATQSQHHDIPAQHTSGLPGAYRGRCQPRQVKSFPIRSLTKLGRPGDFQPQFEVRSFATMKQITQLRRIRSLKRQLCRLQGCPIDHRRERELHKEWTSILKQRNFAHWCNQTPEVGPPPQGLPSIDFLNDVDQIMTFETNHRVYSEANTAKAKSTFARQLDRKFHGSSQAFAVLRDTPSNYVDSLTVDIDEQGVVVSDPTDDTWEIFVDRSREFNLVDCVQVNSLPCRIVDINSDSIVVKRNPHLQLTSEEVSLCQTQTVVDKGRIFELLTQFWQPFWQSTSAVSSEDSHSFESFLQMLPSDLPEISVTVDDLSLWKSAIHDSKAHSARGVDAISAAEMKVLPDAAVADLITLITTVYHKGFPNWFMLARTFPLGKVEGSPAPGQIRPISVLSQIYRIWARVRCKQILFQLSAAMPVEIQGLLSHRGPLEAAYQQQFDHESCQMFDQAAGGMSIDLIKCFNTMCRRCGSLALRALRLPESLIVQWEASIQVLTRVWELESDCSLPIASSNGYPEGDTWSVVVMVILAYCWIVALKSQARQCCITAYADNWGWFTVNPRMHRVLIDQTVLFVRATNVQIDWEKSWSWSTNSAHQQAIKGALQSHGKVGQVSQVNSAMNLGCQMTYRGPPKLGKFRKRLTTALNRLDRLAKLTRPLDEKIRLVAASVYACAFYGVQFIPVGCSHFSKIRTQVADSLLGPSISRNSAIAIDCLSGLDDPMVVAIALALKSARRFLLWASSSQKSNFLKIASRHSGLHSQCRGPAGCLKYFLLQLGWSISPLGQIHTQQQGTLDLCGIGLKPLMAAIRQAWTHDLFLMSDRQCLHGLFPICQVSTHQVLRQFTLTEQRCLLSDIAGSFQTRSQQAKWDPAVTSKCPLCDGHDTRYHRVFECRAFSEVRSRFQRCLEYFLEQGSLVHEIPVIHVNPALDFVRLLQAQHPEATIPDELYGKLSQLVVDLHRDGKTLSFYTDGSCQFPQCPVTRFASYSIILDTCLTNEDREQAAKIYQTTGLFPPCLVPLTAARTTGSQCIQRSELFAITRIIELFVAGQVHTDSALAIHHVNQCANATALHQVQHLSDFDLVSRLFRCHNLSQHNLVKVKAHVDPHTVPHLLTAYQTLGNQLANDKAIQACWNHLPALVSEYWSLHLQYELEKEHLSQYYRFLLELFQCRKQMEQQHPVDEGQQQLQTPQSRVNFFEVLSTWTVLNPWTMTPCRVNLFAEGTWGRTITTALSKWLERCTWPDGTPDSRDNFGVTWMELTTSFLLFIGRWLPLKRATGGGKESLVIFDSRTQADAYGVEFSEQVRGFCQLFGQANDLASTDLWPKLPRGLVRSTYLIGGSTFPAGVRMRPVFPFQERVCRILQSYFQQQQGVAYKNLPDLEFDQPTPSTAQLRLEISGGWKERSSRFHRAAVDMRKIRKNPQQPLQFQA